MVQDDIKEPSARAISIEGDVLNPMVRDLPLGFSDAVEVILRTKGRVIVSCAGKSRHIGNKIEAICPILEHLRFLEKRKP